MVSHIYSFSIPMLTIQLPSLPYKSCLLSSQSFASLLHFGDLEHLNRRENFHIVILSIFVLDIQCVTLVLSDSLKMLCDSTYTTGVGYEGDTCSFTCDTGYELSGSDTRTCLGDSSWSGDEAMCIRGV